MATFSIVFPIRPDKLDQARHAGQEKMGPRAAASRECSRRIGVTRDSWHLQQLPDGAVLIISIDSDDVAGAFAKYAADDGPYARWERQQIEEITGLDLTKPLAGPQPETLADLRD
jgi:hypothetical protein